MFFMGPFELLIVSMMALLFIVVPVGVVIWAFMDKGRRDCEREKDG